MSDMTPFVPNYYDGNKEMYALINGEQPSFDKFQAAITKFLENQFVMQADEDGIATYESELGIIPTTGAALESRRRAVLLRLLPPAPITWKYFKQLVANLKIPITPVRDVINQTLWGVFENYIPSDVEVSELNFLFNTLTPANMYHVLRHFEQSQTNLNAFYGSAQRITAITNINYTNVNLNS